MRGAADIPSAARSEPTGGGSAMVAVLRIPTMWWIILSGALQNLVMYALFSFLTSFLLRYHGLTIKEASWINGLAVGIGGSFGMLGGGWLCDRAGRSRVSGRLLVGALAMILAAPCFWLALETPRGAGFAFAALLVPAYIFVYVYYSSVYATIQDIVAPTLRGTAMAVYFFVFYLFAAAGLYAFGWLSDHLAQSVRAANAVPVAVHMVGIYHTPSLVPVPSLVSASEARAVGLHQALYVVPALLVLLALVLLAAARTVTADQKRSR